MISPSIEDAYLDNSRRGEMRSEVAYSNPQMIEISLYEIKSFLITESIPKIMMLVGSLLLGSIISAFISEIPIHPIIITLFLALFVSGVIIDAYLIRTKFKELEEKGAEKWR
jgi:hypothetical protein